MFFIAHTHNAIGRFYEVQGYGPDPYTVRPDREATSREWFRPLPPVPDDEMGTAQQRQHRAVRAAAFPSARRRSSRDLSRQLLAEEQALGRKRPDRSDVRLGDSGRSAPQGGRGRRRQRSAPPGSRDLGRVGVVPRGRCSPSSAGDYIVRADQPFRTLAAMYFAIQRFPSGGPGRTTTRAGRFSCCATSRVIPVDDASILSRAMTPLTRDATARGGIVEGAGPFLVVEHTADTHLATFRFRNAGVKMTAAEQDFEIPTASGPRRIRAGSIVIPNADRAILAPQLEALGLVGVGAAVGAARSRRTTSTCRASATCTAGRERRTRAGGGRRSTRTAFRTPTSPIRSCGTETCARSTT